MNLTFDDLRERARTLNDFISHPGSDRSETRSQLAEMATGHTTGTDLSCSAIHPIRDLTSPGFKLYF